MNDIDRIIRQYHNGFYTLEETNARLALVGSPTVEELFAGQDELGIEEGESLGEAE